MAAAETIGYTSAANAEAQGWTVAWNYAANDGTYDGDDGLVPVTMPTWSAGKKWLGIKDPDVDNATAQQIYACGNGYACFISAAAIAQDLFPDYESSGFDGGPKGNGLMSGPSLVFGFTNADMALDLVLTKEATYNSVNYFVLRMQWQDEYDAFMQTGGAAAEGYYPSGEYVGNNGSGSGDFPDGWGDLLKKDAPKTSYKKKKKKNSTRAAQEKLFSGELWLGEDGSVRMLYGTVTNAKQIYEAAVFNGYAIQTNGIYFNNGVPVDGMQGAQNFHDFATNPLNYSTEHTEDGNINQPIADWYYEYLPPTQSNPFVSEAPADSKTYGRKDEKWVEITASSGGGGGAGSGRKADGSYEPHVLRELRDMYMGIDKMLPFQQYSGRVDSGNFDSGAPVMAQPYIPYRDFTYGSSNDSTKNKATIYVENLNDWRGDSIPCLCINSIDLDDNDIYFYDYWEEFTEKYQREGTLENWVQLGSGYQTGGTVFLFGSFSFWRCFEDDPDITPENSVKWQRLTVDTWIPIAAAYEAADFTPTQGGSYMALPVDTTYFTDPSQQASAPNNIYSFYDFIGCTEAEFTGSELAAMAELPKPIQDAQFINPELRADTYDPAVPIGASWRWYGQFQNRVPEANSNGNGGGGGGIEARNEGVAPAFTEGQLTPVGELQQRPIDKFNVAPAPGMALIYRQDPEYDQNVGKPPYGSGGGIEAYEAAKQKRDADRKAKKEKRAAEIAAARKNPTEKGIPTFDSSGNVVRNASGLGWTPPGYDPDADDCRFMDDQTFRVGTNRVLGQYQFDVIGLQDIWGFNEFVGWNEPVDGDTIVWDALNGFWQWESMGGAPIRKKHDAAKLETIIQAVKDNPELKAALKAALAD